MPPRRVVVIQREEYRIVRRNPPSTPPRPPKKGGGGGWLVVALVIGGLVVIGKLAGGDGSPAAPVVKQTGRRVLVSSRIEGERCLAPGAVNGQSLVFTVDTGAPQAASFPSSWADRLNLKNLQYQELWPGTRYGKIATATVREIRIGDVVWKNEQARFYSDWAYSFGNTRPLLGLAALNAHGVHVEFDGDICRLTVAK